MIWNCAYNVKDDQAFIYLVLFPELNLKYIGSKKVDKNGNWKTYYTPSGVFTFTSRIKAANKNGVIPPTVTKRCESHKFIDWYYRT